MTNVHIALDFDQTLATYEHSWDSKKVGEPVPEMIKKVKEWLSKGYKITIFTARLTVQNPFKQEAMIRVFLEKYGLPQFDITATKHYYFTHFIDDKAYHVVPNKGIIDPECNL